MAKDENLTLLSEMVKLPTLAALHGAWKYQKNIIKSHFDRGNQTRFGWPPLTPAYAKRKQAKYGDKPMLVATEAMKKATIGHGTVRVNGDIINIEWTRLPFYAGFVSRTREFLDPDQQDEQEIEESVAKYIKKVEKARALPPSPFQDI